MKLLITFFRLFAGCLILYIFSKQMENAVSQFKNGTAGNLDFFLTIALGITAALATFLICTPLAKLFINFIEIEKADVTKSA